MSDALLAALGIASGIIGLLAYIPYLRDIFRHTTKPERATWLIWTVLSVVSLGSQIAEGGRWSLIMAAANLLSVAVIFLLSIKYGVGGFHWRDRLSLVCAAMGLILWAVIHKPLAALILVVLVDVAGAWLTVYKAYKDPASETVATWWIDCICNLLGALAVGAFNFALLLMPLYLLLANLSVVLAIYLGRAKQHAVS